SFSIDVNHRAGNIEFNRLSFDGFGTAENISFDELNETETLEKFVNKNPRGFPASTFAAKIGLRGRGVISDRHQFIRRLFFVENGSSSPDFAKYLLAVSVQATLQNGTHKLLSFDLEFSADKMPVTPPLSGLGQVPFTLLVQRQPHGEQWQNDFEIRQWTLETQFPQPTALDYWNKFVAEPVNFSLRTISSGRPVSFIPKLETNITRKTFWKAAFSVFDRVPESRIEDEQFALKRGGDDFRNNEISIVGRSLSPDSENAEAADFQVNGRFESLRTIQAAVQPLRCRFQLKAHEPEKELQTLLETGFNFKAVQIQPPVQVSSTVEEDFEEQKVRMGALEINFLPVLQRSSSGGSEIPGLPSEGDSVFFKATFPKKPGAGNFTPGSIINRQIKYRLAVPDIRPGGQDDIPGSEFVSDLGVSLDSDETYREKFRREPALIIIPKEEADAPGSTIEKPPFYVTIQETITEESSQSIALRLHRIDEPSAALGQARDLYVFDPQPLFFAKVEVGDFTAALNAAITNELGNWTNRADVGAGWELSAGATGFDLVLPPQGLGEAMHRRTEDDDIEPNSPIDFRFTPPTKARLQASYFRQRFVEAPWNLRRILGYPGQRAAGAGVDEIDFELLYGLRGKLKAAHLRLTEIGARLGFLPGEQPPRLFWAASEKQNDNYELARKLWSDLYQQLQSRLAVLELRDENVPGKLRLDEGNGLSFELRPENLREPVNPIPGDENRLAGSFAWAFESNNVYRQLRRNPRSTAAQLVAPFFSSLGGWGNQKAVFGLTTIYSDVTMGRVQSINIERIGRIGVFRNRAKHVIVYERTVVPSRQFFLEQHPLVGNAVLRKVDEYIELIEEERRYPENGLDNLARGFVLGCRFAHGKPPRIRVNSRWGEDVGTIGWKIPLWVRGAAPSDVYPKPVINLIMTGERAGEEIITEIDEPEKLYFYTSTEDTAGLDTDAWASVENVDFAVVPKNTAFDTFAEDALAESFSAPLAPPPPKESTSGNPNDFKPEFDDLPVHAGSGGFTFALAAPPKPINVVAERAEKAIGSFLRNVTVMRGIAVETINDINFLNFVKFRDGLSNVFAPLIADLSNDNIELERAKFNAIVRKAVSNVQKFKMLYGRISDFLKIGADANFEKSLRNETVGRIAAQFEIDRALIKQEIIAVAREGIEETKAEIRRLQTQFPVLDDRAKDEIRRHLLTIFEGTDDAPGILTKSKQVRGTVGEVVLSINRASARVDETLSVLKQEIGNTKCRICELPNNSTKPAEIRRTVAETRSRINEIFAQVDFLVAEPVRFWTGSQLYKFSENARTKWLEIERLMRKLEFDVRIFTPQTQQNAIGKLEEVSRKLAGFQGDIHERLKSWERLFIQDEFQGQPFLEHPFFLALVKPIEDWQKTIDTVLRVADSWQAFNTEIDKQINSFLTLADDFFSASLVNAQKQIGALVGRLHRDFLPSLIELEKYFLDNQIGLFNEGAVEKLIEDWDTKIPTSSELRREFETLRTAMSKGLNDFINRSKISVTLSPGNLPRTSANDTLQLLRSYGKTPRVPSLNFPLPESGYYFFDLENKIKELATVKLTPALAQANKLLDAAGQEAKKLLNPIEIRLPTVDLAERLIPFDLQNFDWSKLIPNCAGLKLDALFPKLRAPVIATDRVKITQDFNPETQSGWLQIDLDVPFGDQPITVFSLAGVTLRLLKADFVAVARLEAAVGQPPRQNVRGRISGDWDLQVGGFPIALLANCSLIFEEGKGIRFDISPDRVRLQQILAFLAELLAKFGYSDKGFSVAITPTGIRSILDLPLPDVQSGSFGLANLRLGFTFGLEITDNFRITTGLSVGRKDAPFTITIFILGGAGWFTLNVTYTPQTREFTTEVSIGILAAASLAIALGPIKGGVYAYFGISVEYKASNQNPSSLTIGLLLMFVG
ncbi:MAG TPA: hypothetical protein VGB00_04460, partial [Pyrinomonadaceae bacterium]